MWRAHHHTIIGGAFEPFALALWRLGFLYVGMPLQDRFKKFAPCGDTLKAICYPLEHARQWRRRIGHQSYCRTQRFRELFGERPDLLDVLKVEGGDGLSPGIRREQLQAMKCIVERPCERFKGLNDSPS